MLQKNKNSANQLQRSELRSALAACRHSFFFAAFFSLFINLLMLVPTIYMLQLYGRVMASRSVQTLVMLTLIVLVLFITMGLLENARSRILVRAGNKLDSLLSNRLFDVVFALANRQPGRSTAQPLADLTSLRQFLTGPGPFAFFDAPWMPIYLGVLFLFHPWFGWFAVGAALILVAITIFNERGTKKELGRANALSRDSINYVGSSLRNAEVVQAMGMREGIRRRWQEKYWKFLASQTKASDTAGIWANLSKTMRVTLQSMILGLGGYLAVINELNPGMMIAGSIIMGRALAPIDMLTNGWRGFVEARAAYSRLDQLLEQFPDQEKPMPLPAPKGAIEVSNLYVTPPQASQPALKGINLVIAPGEVVALIGPSASGKSTLARALLGVWPLLTGKVRIDKADIEHWDSEELGRFVGYLPQDIELFEGTIAENIARFGEADPAKVVATANLAGVHEMILQLPAGYDSLIGPGGVSLSAGQRQRVALARALYGDPVFIVLDEPNSNLDEQGEKALVAAVARIKARGATVLIISHRPGILGVVDKIALLVAGQLQAFGPRDEVLAALKQAQQPVQKPAQLQMAQEAGKKA